MRASSFYSKKITYCYLFLSTLSYSHYIQANNGVMLSSYGAKASGMAGVSVALPQDAIASANNPAGMAVIGNRVDGDLTLIDANIHLKTGGERYHDRALVPVPDFGFNRVINDRMTFGVTVFGQGAALNYKQPAYGSTSTKSSLTQLQVAPTLTWKIADHHYLGFSPRIAYQTMNIKGVENFGFHSQGRAHALGAGAALGYLWQPTETLTLGATYASPVWFQKLDGYEKLLPNGRLNLPQQAGVGAAYQLSPQLTIAADFLWLDWSSQHGYGNRLSNRPLGTKQGPGFGWKDQKLLRLGMSYTLNPAWTLRSGVSFSNHYIPRSEATFAALAPFSEYTHYSVGATYHLSAQTEITGAYLRGIQHTLKGNGASTGSNSGADVNYFTLGIGYRF